MLKGDNTMHKLKTSLAFLAGFLAALFLFLAVSSHAAEEGAKAKPKTYPVLLAGREVFGIERGVGSFTARERAEAISKRLERAAASNFKYTGKPTVTAEGSQFNISVGDLVLVSISEADAYAVGSTPESLARYYAGEIDTALNKAREDFSIRGALISTLYAVLSIVAMFTVILLLGIGSRRLQGKINSWKGTWIRNLQIQKVQIVSAEVLTTFLVRFLHLARFILVIICIYFLVPVALSFFPLTRNYAHLIIGFVVNPLTTIGKSLVAFIPNFFFMIVIGFVTFYLLKFFRVIFLEIEAGTIRFSWFYPEWAMPTYQLLRFLILALALISAFPYIPGSDSPAFKGVSLFLGVLLSFASSSSISNIIAGVIITYTRGFKVGDRAQIGETVGDIIETTLLVTRVRTIKNVVVTIPNSSVMSSHIINFSTAVRSRGALILHTSITIGYDAPWREVHELLIKAALATPEILPKPAPFVLQTSLDDFYVSYQVNAYTEKPSMMAVTYSALHQNIQDVFNEAGVEIMSPHYGSLRDGNEATIPADKRKPGYEPPRFKLDVLRP